MLFLLAAPVFSVHVNVKPVLCKNRFLVFVWAFCTRENFQIRVNALQVNEQVVQRFEPSEKSHKIREHSAGDG